MNQPNKSQAPKASSAQTADSSREQKRESTSQVGRSTDSNSSSQGRTAGTSNQSQFDKRSKADMPSGKKDSEY